jgi:uncharacterized membrane protein (DUF106 family)
MSTLGDPLRLIDEVRMKTAEVQKKLEELRGAGDQLSVAQMFEMQMLMNQLSQLSEMASSVISASNSAIASIARNVKS